MLLKHSGTRILFIDYLQREKEQNLYRFSEIFKLGRIKFGRKKVLSRKNLNRKTFGQRKDSGLCKCLLIDNKQYNKEQNMYRLF